MANAEQIEYWNDHGTKWVRLEDRLNAVLEPLGRQALDAAGLEPGRRVLDVGCGCGFSSRAAAARVAPGGRVLGVDVSAPMLARARELGAGVAGLSFLEVDAQTHAFEPGAFDVLTSRFGVMFFESPEVAFANLRLAIAPGGGLAFVCWQELAKNPWMVVPAAAAAQHVPFPPPPEPGAPGPFAFADPDRVRRILETAGFASVRVDPFEGDLSLGEATPEGVEFLLDLGPAGRALREAGADEALRAKVADAISEALEPFVKDGSVAAPFAAWLVTASQGDEGDEGDGRDG